MKDFRTPNKPKKETVESAAVEILTQLGGKAHRSKIIPYILEHVEFSGETPERSISCSLQRAKKVRASEGQRGWWELISYQDELANLKAIIKQREQEIAELEKKYSTKYCVTLEQVEAEIMECPDWATAKSRIDDINRSGILAETEWAKVAKRIQRAFKQKQEQIRNSQTEALQAVAGKKTIGTLVLEQNNHGVTPDKLEGGKEQNLLTNE